MLYVDIILQNSMVSDKEVAVRVAYAESLASLAETSQKYVALQQACSIVFYLIRVVHYILKCVLCGCSVFFKHMSTNVWHVLI